MKSIWILLLILCSLVLLSSLSCVTLSPTATATAPVINTFTANPPSISMGGKTTLNWKVSGATKVSIDPDIGSVALEGNRLVSPGVTTIYTITAMSASGITSTATVQVIIASEPTDGTPTVTTTPPTSTPPATGSVTPSPGSVLPAITYFTAEPPSITAGNQSKLLWSVANASSVMINHGIGTVGLVGTHLVSPAVTTSYILTASNAAGSHTATVNLVVSPVVTSSPYTPPETTMTVIPLPVLVYDFVANAGSATWMNGASSTSLGFGIAQEDGFARLHTNQLLDDGNTYPKVLETHPQWVNNGSIHGHYPMITIPPGAKFTAKLGFLNGASGSDGVKFWLTWTQFDGGTVSFPRKSVFYGGALDTYQVDLAPYAGQYGRFGLHVESGTSSAQDWATWEEAKITR